MADWVTLLLGIGWLIREIIGRIVYSVSENRLMRTKNKNEFEYHKKRYIFESVSPIYREMYSLSKKIHGYSKALSIENVNSFSQYHPEVLSTLSKVDETFTVEDYIGRRNHIEYFNVIYYSDMLRNLTLDFQNLSSENSVVLSNDVNILSEIIMNNAIHLYKLIDTDKYITEDYEKYSAKEHLNKVDKNYNDYVRLLRENINILFITMQLEMGLIEDKTAEEEISKIRAKITEIQTLIDTQQ